MSLHYTCPICSLSLELNLENNRLSCDNNHSFDMAKEGYFNLLPVQLKKSKVPGDSKEMVMARRNFLARGHYNFLRDALCISIADVASNGPLLDLGCGEGFYTHKFAEQHNVTDAYGLDISKTAVKYAAKRFKNCQFSVASSSNAPFNTATFSTLVSVFSPLFEAELHRLCGTAANLIVASPGSEHLKELKALIYRDVNEHQPVATPKGFKLEEHTLYTQQVSLELEELSELINMTPFAWKFRPEHWQNLKECVPMSVTLSFYVSVFSKEKD
jgi:23S rRNA (guanine745-N1)-methyltransferase